jgi:hypothetical protein
VVEAQGNAKLVLYFHVGRTKRWEERTMSEEKTKRLELIYQDAATNLRFLKQQEWVITRYALTAYAVLVGLATQMTFRCPLVVAVVLISVLNAVILHHFIGSMQRFRDRIDWIHRYAYPPEEQKPLRLAESDDLLNTSLYIHILIFIALVGAVIAEWAILNIKAAGT